MVKYYKTDKYGTIPNFSFKNSKYWIDHDLRHIKDSFRWCIRNSLWILLALIPFTYLYVTNNGFSVISTIYFSLGFFLAFFFVLLVIKTLFTKGYGIHNRLGGAYKPNSQISKIMKSGLYIKDTVSKELINRIEAKSGNNQKIFNNLLLLLNSTNEAEFEKFLENSHNGKSLWKDYVSKKNTSELRDYDFVAYGKEIISKNLH